MGANVADFSVIEDREFTVDEDSGPESERETSLSAAVFLEISTE
jgi:hypothetical protein